MIIIITRRLFTFICIFEHLKCSSTSNSKEVYKEQLYMNNECTSCMSMENLIFTYLRVSYGEGKIQLKHYNVLKWRYILTFIKTLYIICFLYCLILKENGKKNVQVFL